MTYDSYLASLGYDYNPARDIDELAQWSAVATVATLVDVEDGRIFGDTVDSPEGRHLNLVFETADATRYYVQLPRPESSSIEQLRSVLPIGTESVIYLQSNNDPDDGVWFNKREDGNEWFFTSPQGWILDHPSRGIVFPLERGRVFATNPEPAESLHDWLPSAEPEVAESPPAGASLEPSAGSDDAVWRVDDGRLVGRWERIATAVRAEAWPGIVAIDDTRLVVVRSMNGGYDVAAYVYDSATGVATAATPSGFGWRGSTTVVWTGEQVLVVGGGSGVDDSPAWLAYDPVADAWDEFTVDSPPDGRWVGHGGVWTGTELVFFADDGLALDPQTGSWRVLAASPLAERLAATVVWTGEEIIVWGGCDASIPQCDDFARGLLTDGAIYEPSSDRWREMAASPLPPGNRPSAAWTGTEVIYYAGLVEPGTAAAADVPIAASYDPALDRWTVLPEPPFVARQLLGLAWSASSDLLFAWGGSVGFSDGDQFDDGAVFDPSSNTWLMLPDAPQRSARQAHSVATVGTALYVDGGWPAFRPMILIPE